MCYICVKLDIFIMRKSVFIIRLFVFSQIFFAQNIYKVKAGDTLYNISKTQNVSIDYLYQMNPGLEKSGLKEGLGIKIDNNAEETQIINTELSNKGSVYIIEKGDTLYGVSKKLETSIDELIKCNEGLTAENIKIGQVLNTSSDSVINKPFENNDKSEVAISNNYKNYYVVQKGDTLYSLAKRFNIDEADLRAYNPVLVNELKVGQKIHFPDVEDGFITHKVKKKETIFSITRKYNVSLLELLDHNPSLINGLKIGMNLKIPIKSIENYDKDIVKDEVANRYEEGFNVLYILPFNSSDFRSSKKRSYSTAEFYMGSLFALDSLATKGMKINVETFDNKGLLSETKSIVREINFDNFDLIIGPLRSENVHWVSDHLKEKKIKIISPFSRSVNVDGRENLIKTNLTQEVIIEKLSYTIKLGNQYDSIFIIGNDNVNLKNDLAKQFGESYIEQITSVKNYDFTKIPEKSSIILNTINASVAKSALVKMHDEKVNDNLSKVFAIGYNAAYVKGKGVNKSYLGAQLLTDLGLTAIIPNYFNDNKYNVYKTKYDYRKENQGFPDKYSSAGFDWTYYMILNDEYNNPVNVREGLFNKIKLEKIEGGGFVNKGIFTIKY